LIFCSYASQHDGYNLDFKEFDPVDRELVEMELARGPKAVEAPERHFWLFPTEHGIELLESLPREAFLREK
jgi:hypothetical protein